MNYKKICAIGLAAVIGLQSTIYAGEIKSDYDQHWAKETIQAWIEDGYIHGYENGEFRPKQPISRAEFVALVNRRFGYMQEKEITFEDVNPVKWYYRDIKIAMQAGYIDGMSETSFAPEESMTREQAAKMVVAIGDLQLDAEGIKRFKDVAEIAAWAKPSVGGAANEGVMNGTPEGTFRPKAELTRAEAIVLLDNLIKKDNRTVYQDYTMKGNQTELKDALVKGDLIIDSSVVQSITLDNVTVEGKVIVKGAKPGVNLVNTQINEMKLHETTTLKLENSSIKTVEILSTAQNTIIDATDKKAVIDYVKVYADSQLKGNYNEVTIFNPNLTVDFSDAQAEIVRVKKEAEHVAIKTNEKTVIKQLILEGNSTEVTGKGTIESAIVSGEDITFETMPEEMEVSPEVQKPPVVKPDEPSGGGGSGDGGTTEPGTVKVESVKLDQISLALEVKKDATLTATINPSNATNKNITWTTSDKAVATVSETGVVTAVSEGKAIITATTEDGSKTATCEVTVKAPVVEEAPQLSDVKAEKYGDGYISLEFTTNKDIDLSVFSSKGNVIIKYLDAEGKVIKEKNKTWAGYLNDKAGNKYGKGVGEEYSNDLKAGTYLTTYQTPAEYDVASLEIIFVDNTGTRTTQTVVFEQAPVKVESVALDAETLALEVGSDATLTATINPSDATNKKVTWTTSDETVATVSETGVVTAVSEGKAIITVTTEDGNKTATCEVNVKAPVVEEVPQLSDVKVEKYGDGYISLEFTTNKDIDLILFSSKGNVIIKYLDAEGKVIKEKNKTWAGYLNDKEGNKYGKGVGEEYSNDLKAGTYFTTYQTQEGYDVASLEIVFIDNKGEQDSIQVIL